MLKDDNYYSTYAKRCKLIFYILDDLEKLCERLGTIYEFHVMRPRIFEALEDDGLTLSDLIEYRRTGDFKVLLDEFGLTP